MSTTGPGSEPFEKSWVMMMQQTDKEHDEYEEACSANEVHRAEKSGL